MGRAQGVQYKGQAIATGHVQEAACRPSGSALGRAPPAHLTHHARVAQHRALKGGGGGGKGGSVEGARGEGARHDQVAATYEEGR